MRKTIKYWMIAALFCFAVFSILLPHAAHAEGKERYLGIDVSQHQGYIDWDTVAGNVDFVILRCGYAEDNPAYDDTRWNYNVSACERLGIPYGVYLYSYFESVADAISEAEHTLRLLSGHRPALPVYIDLEDAKVAALSNAQIVQYTNLWLQRINVAGYQAGVYANYNWWTNRLNDLQLDSRYKWLAAWGSGYESYARNYAVWQYTNSGSVPGITGAVDCNYCWNLDKWVKTDPAPTPTPFPVSFTIRDDNSLYFMNETTAQFGWITVYTNGNINSVKTIGCELYSDSDVMLANHEEPSNIKGDHLLHYFRINGDPNESDICYTLSPSTNYKFRVYVIYNGQKYYGDWRSFKTTGQAEPSLISGSCGEHITWTLDENGLLKISGTGAIPDSVFPLFSSVKDQVFTAVIENGVTGIGKNAFAYLRSLQSVDIADSVTVIGDYAFTDCYQLSQIYLPDAVTYIGECAFRRCGLLTQINIPEHIQTINDCAFIFCENLAQLNMPENCPLQEMLRCYHGDLVTFMLPASLETLGYLAFDFTQIGQWHGLSIDYFLPEYLETIDAEAFANTDAAYVRIPNSVKSIESRAFADCAHLRYVSFRTEEDVFIADDAFEGCTDLIFFWGGWGNGDAIEKYAIEHGFQYIENECVYGEG